MLFVGAIPRPVVEQALRVVDIAGATDVYCCCSGSFRLEQALGDKRPELKLHSNDVSLLSTAIGRHAVGDPLDFSFHGRLEFLQRFAGQGSLERLAALAIAVRLGHYRGKSHFARSHFAHYEAHAAEYVKQVQEKLIKYFSKLRIASFHARDFREHARAGIEAGAPVFAWPPTYKGGYEQLYRLIGENTTWAEPAYEVWDPKQLGSWLCELEDAGGTYCVFADHEVEDAPRRAAAVYKPGRARNIFLYTSRPRGASVRREPKPSKPFRYELVDPAQLGPTPPRIEAVRVGHTEMNFVKDKYLATGLAHSDGMMRWLIFLDGKLAGGFIYTMSSMGGSDPTEVYLLCDFSVRQERRLSKLIAMLATGQDQIRVWERARLIRIKLLRTTALTDKPVSMKYRGIYELLSRKPGFLNYGSKVRDLGNAAIYADWYKRLARSSDRTQVAA
ncbi:MAG: hypothetical protein AMXMBFR56_65630 [Polyangiaceae bacterium]